MVHFVFCFLFVFSFSAMGQPALRKFSTVINHPALNIYAPYISADGRSLVYLSDNAEGGVLALFYTTKHDAVNWKIPSQVPTHKVNMRLTFPPGHALKENGEQYYFTSLKSGGLGGFDLYRCDIIDDIWSMPITLGLPINSRGHDASPSISADGSTLYFMRCEDMNQKQATGCRLFYSKKSRLNKWSPPIEMPDYINTGNSQSPRIMGDGETLIFSSDQFLDNQGGMDLYVTQFNGTAWSSPEPLHFANTADNDQYISASSYGRYLLKSQLGQRKYEVVELLFPPSVRPKHCTRIEGTVAGSDPPVRTYISVFDHQQNRQIYHGSPDKKGTFTVYINEGGIYDLAIEPEKADYTFYSKIYDLREGKILASDQLNAKIVPLEKDIELMLEDITFMPHSSIINPHAYPSLLRMGRMIKENPERFFRIELYFDGYKIDSLQSSIDLTEQKIDTIRNQAHQVVEDTLILELDTLSTALTKEGDSTGQITERKHVESIKKRVKDSTVQIAMVEDSTRYTTRRWHHNDRTPSQAMAIKNYLIGKKIPVENVTWGYQINNSAVVENREAKTRVKIKLLN